MIGFANYYIRTISYPSRLNRWIYIMYYSCLKTLAIKFFSLEKNFIDVERKFSEGNKIFTCENFINFLKPVRENFFH